MISKLLYQCLEDLENRIDPEQETRLHESWCEFANGGYDGEIFSPYREKKIPPAVDWPSVSVNSALEDYEIMALQQFGSCSTSLENGSGDLLNVRCNYGTAILPSIFGLEVFVMDEETNTLPTVRPVNSLEKVKEILDQGIPPLTNGFGARVFGMAERFAEMVDLFPKVKQFTSIYHPDIQGPMDGCELIFGSSLFYALYDNPDVVIDLLELVSETYTRFMAAWNEIHPFKKEGNSHWGMFHRGNIMIRDDSAMNLSKDMVNEFIVPYDQRLLSIFGGGCIHFCGKGDHFIDVLTKMEGVTAMNLMQPELNNMDTIFENTIDRGIPLLGLALSTAQSAVENGRELHGLVHVV